MGNSDAYVDLIKQIKATGRQRMLGYNQKHQMKYMNGREMKLRKLFGVKIQYSISGEGIDET